MADIAEHRRTTRGSVLRRAAALLAVGVAVSTTLAGCTPAPGPGTGSAAPASTASTTATDSAASGSSGTAVFAADGEDLPGDAVLDRCRSDRRAAVTQYDTAALGRVVMQCGDDAQGYRHVTVRHERDWTDELAGLGTDRDWDDLMFTAVRTALTEPATGLPSDAGDGKVCYAAPIRFADGTAPTDGFVKVIVSATTDRVITAYPTDDADC